MPVIEELFETVITRPDWTINTAGVCSVSVPPDLAWFYDHAGETVIGDREFDGENIWLFKLIAPENLKPSIDVANHFQTSTELLQESEAKYLYQILESPDSINDIAIAIDGKFAGNCFLLEEDSLAPPMRVSRVANSFSDLVEILLRVTEPELEQASELIDDWISSAPFEYLMAQRS